MNYIHFIYFPFYKTILFIYDKCRVITLFNAHNLIRLKIVMFGIYDEYQSYIKHLKILILLLSLFKGAENSKCKTPTSLKSDGINLSCLK